MTSQQPRSISASIGRRIRVVLGENGNQWVLLLNHDDGNREWQTQHWSPTLPKVLAEELLTCCSGDDDYCNEVAFAPGLNSAAKSWYIHGTKKIAAGETTVYQRCFGMANFEGFDAQGFSLDAQPIGVSFGTHNNKPSMCLIKGNNHSAYANIPSGLVERIKQIQSQEKKHSFYSTLSQWWIFYSRDDNGAVWKTGGGCSKQLKRSHLVTDVAVAKNHCYLIIKHNTFTAGDNVDPKLVRVLKQFYSQQEVWYRQRNQEISAYHARARQQKQDNELVEEIEQFSGEMERHERAKLEEEIRKRQERAKLEEVIRKRQERAKLEEETRKRQERAKLEEQIRKREEQTRKAVVLESSLEEQFAKEKTNIEETERQVRAMQQTLTSMKANLVSRKRRLLDSIQRLPEEKRQCLQLPLHEDEIETCVICQEHPPVRAGMPCGHLCLCDGCALSLVSGKTIASNCPLCRAPMQGVLKIFGGRPSSY